MLAAGADVTVLPGGAQPRSRPRHTRLSYYSFRAAEAAVSVLPRTVSDPLATALATVAVTVAPGKFAGLKTNLRHVVPDASESDLRRLLRRNVRNWTRSWLDVLEMRSRPQEVTRRLGRIVGKEHYDRAIATGRGVVVVSLHYGIWEAGLAAWNGLGGNMAVLAERMEPPELFERMLGSRGALGVKVIPIDVAAMRGASDPAAARRAGAAAMRQVMRQLKNGGVIALAVDRDLVGNGELLPFFGVPAPIPVGTIEVGMRAGATILPVVLERFDRYRVHGVVFPPLDYDPDAPRESEVRRLALQMLGVCEEAIRAHPDQWHVAVPIWPRGSEGQQ